MSAKSTVSKSEAVRDYLKAHPAAPTKEIVAALDKQGIKITFGHVATIKAVMYETAAPFPKPAEPLTLEQIKMLAQAIRRIRLRGEAVAGKGAWSAFWRR